ncbi:hypothetical protein Ahy_B09g098471 [Arachis hypogaea]|uniref:Uncharacterized protein n=1 Tax=Arachis hypogaea TaxID=3818 RepID=A0A444XRB7_ARAHY|nr:hypothetical protein Ahy_B09g098471 [Arachis hypogaea]
MGDSDFTIDIHHGDKFHDIGNGLKYLGGRVLEDMHFELDEWSLQEIVSELQKLGYKGYARRYCEPGCQLSSGLRELMSDGDAMRMGRLLVSQTVKHCSVYVVDGCREAEYSGSGFIEVEVEGESEASSEEDRFDDSADDGDHNDHFGFDIEDGNDGGFANAFGGDDVEVGKISEGYETEDIDSYEGDSDDMIKKRRYPKYNEAEMSREYEFKVGLEFKSLGRFKDAIREHALLNGRNIRYIKNDKTPNGKHTCRRNYSDRLASSEEKGEEEVHGRAILQYGKLRDYCAEIMRTNSRSTSQIFVDMPSITHQPRFMRMYMCLYSIKQGFLAGCRSIIRVDGCHLKGDHGQQKKAKKYEGTIMPKPKKRLDVIATQAMEWQARWAGGLAYEVSHKNRMIVERFVVDLFAGTCS